MSTAEMQVASRRAFLAGGVAVLGAATLITVSHRALAASGGNWVTIENFSASGDSLGTVRVRKLVRPDVQWKALLSPESFEVTRRAGTEPAFTGAYWNNHADGLYRRGSLALYGAHGHLLYTMRCAPRSCVRRRPKAHRPSVLHEFRRAEIPPARQTASLIWRD